MQTITKLLAGCIMLLCCQMIQAQQDSTSTYNRAKIEALKDLKETVKTEEREALKNEVEAINKRLEAGEITNAEAEKLKKEAAKKRALNIENRLAIIENKIAFLQRNTNSYTNVNDDDPEGFVLRIGGGETNEGIVFFGKRKYDRPRRYDRRTSSDLVFAFGFNNALIDGESLDDSPYKVGGSRFFELGWAWKTRVFKNTNFLRLKYGISLQVNGLKPTDNRYFVEDGDVTTLETFEHDLSKSKLSVSNLVFPLHFEFGPSKRIDRENYFRYSTHNKLKIGIGGYAGFNIGTRQKLKYTADGDKIKDKIKRDYNTSNLVYGLSGYVALFDVAIYAKYDLSPLFKDQAVDQHNISLGVRFDMD